MSLSLDHYRLLGRSGLRVSPLCLGAMTFGTEWGWGADKDAARTLFDAYVDALVRLPIFAQEVTRYSKGVWSSRLRLYPEGFFEVFLGA